MEGKRKSSTLPFRQVISGLKKGISRKRGTTGAKRLQAKCRICNSDVADSTVDADVLDAVNAILESRGERKFHANEIMSCSKCRQQQAQEERASWASDRHIATQWAERLRADSSLGLRDVPQPILDGEFGRFCYQAIQSREMESGQQTLKPKY